MTGPSLCPAITVFFYAFLQRGCLNESKVPLVLLATTFKRYSSYPLNLLIRFISQSLKYKSDHILFSFCRRVTCNYKNIFHILSLFCHKLLCILMGFCVTDQHKVVHNLSHGCKLIHCFKFFY